MKSYLLIFSLLFSGSLSANDVFKIVMNESGSGNWGAIRYQTTSGQSWFVKGGIFVEILEQEIPEKSSFTVNMSKTKNAWGAIRIDTNNGKSWYLKDAMWKKILESN